MRNNNVSRKDRLRSKRRAPANYLIVCEGKKTEPNYFNGLKKKINELKNMSIIQVKYMDKFG